MSQRQFMETMALGSYRRGDMLTVPVFQAEAPARASAKRAWRQATLLPLKTDLPPSDVTSLAYLSGQTMAGAYPLETELSLLLRHLASPQSYEPANTYPIHRAVPSVRCLFPYRIMLLLPASNGGASLYAYHPNFHALELESLLDRGQDLVDPEEGAIIGIGQPWMIAEKYGEFSPYATSLECGMLKCQLEQLTALLGWQTRATDIDPAHWNEKLAIADPHESVIFATIVRWPPQRQSLFGRSISINLPVWRQQENLTERFPRLTSIWSLNRCTQPIEADTDRRQPVPEKLRLSELDSAPRANVDVLELLKIRNSGNDAVGFAPASRQIGDDFLPKLVQAWKGFRQRRPVQAGEESLEVKILWLHAQMGRPALYDETLSPVPTRLNPALYAQVMRRNLPNPLLRYNMAAITLSFMIVANLADAQSRHGQASFRRLHLAAGCLAHDFCLAATMFDMFARPVRMFTELGLESTFKLGGYLIYQVLAGFNRATNLEIRLL